MATTEIIEKMSLAGSAPKRSRYEIKQLRHKILLLLEKGATDKEIMQTLELEPSQFYRYLSGVQKEMNIQWAKEGNAYTYKFVKRMEKRISQAAQNYHEAKNNNSPEAVDWYRAGLVAETELFDRLQKIGVIPKAIERIDVNVTLDPIDAAIEQERKALKLRTTLNTEHVVDANFKHANSKQSG